LSFGSSRRKNGKIQFVKGKVVTPEFRLVTIGGWILYILGYEFLFRGVLWVTCYAAFGLWAAFAVNIVLYALAHLDQGRFMTYGAIPFGALLCYLAYLTGSFFFAFLIHSWLAVNNLVFPVFSNQGTEKGVNMKGTGV
jgi:membrane protease YdiL (CAAX protease family)